MLTTREYGDRTTGTETPCIGDSLRKRLSVHFAALAAASAMAGVGAARQADASVVYSGPVNINIPTTTAGVYLNVVTGVNNVNPASVPGWDLNPWSSSSLNMFTPTPGPAAGGSHVGSGTSYNNLTVGTLVGPASTFSGTGTATVAAGTPLNFNSTNNFVGFRFINEANGNAVHYGWMRISLTGTAISQPRAIVEYAYEDQAGVAISVGNIGGAGVCCRGATCNASVTMANCLPTGAAGASFAAAASACNTGGSTITPCCYADYNKVSGVSVQDIFDFLGDWFAGSLKAKVGGDGASGALAVQDIFDFLSAWFAGGC